MLGQEGAHVELVEVDWTSGTQGVGDLGFPQLIDHEVGSQRIVLLDLFELFFGHNNYPSRSKKLYMCPFLPQH